MDNESVKKNIMNLRLERSLTQRQMAEELGMARNTYRSIEKGKTQMISETVMKVAEWAGVTPEEIVLGYLPSESGSIQLKEARERFNKRVNEITEEYEARIAGLMKEIRMLNDLLKEKDDNIRNLKSIVALIEKGQEQRKND